MPDLGPWTLAGVKRRPYVGQVIWVRVLLYRAGRSRGQTAAEYIGVLLVVSVIIAAVAATDLGHDITRKLSDLVRDISGGDSGKK
jgi:sorbitol-specific phosphotransferase system component IIBC